MKYFIGAEAEGPNKGRPTLYIASDEAEPEAIMDYLIDNPTIRGVYFGANRTFALPKKYVPLVHKLVNYFKPLHVILEIDYMDALDVFEGDIPEDLVIVYTIHADLDENVAGRAFMIKFEGSDYHLVFSRAMVHRTPANDILYKLDKEIITFKRKEEDCNGEQHED
jgi:hypothetical protein